MNREHYNWFYSESYLEYISKENFWITKKALKPLLNQTKEFSKLKYEYENEVRIVKNRLITLEEQKQTKQVIRLIKSEITRLKELHKKYESEKIKCVEAPEKYEKITKCKQTISIYYSQNKIKNDFDDLFSFYQTQFLKLIGTNSKTLFPFPEEPLFYFPTGLDFRGKHASKSGTHSLGDNNVRSFLQCAWHYPLTDEFNFKQALLTRYIGKNLTPDNVIQKYDELFSVKLTKTEIKKFIKSAAKPIRLSSSITRKRKAFDL